MIISRVCDITPDGAKVEIERYIQDKIDSLIEWADLSFYQQSHLSMLQYKTDKNGYENCQNGALEQALQDVYVIYQDMEHQNINYDHSADIADRAYLQYKEGIS